MTMKQTIETGRKVSKKVALGYAGYRKAKRTFNDLASEYAHTWHINDDYEYELAEVAKKVIKDALANPLIPGRREVRQHEDARFHLNSWTWLPIRGVTFGVQARVDYGNIFFRAARRSDLDAMRAHLEKVAEGMDIENREELDFDIYASTPVTNILAWNGKDGCWQNRKQRTARTFTSVILPAELQAEIEADLKRFTGQASRMQRLELPWRRGFLFEGPPGTGKTSVSLAIAGALSFNLASLSLTDIKSDGQLREAVAMLRPRTVLVIEDIDAYSVSHDRDHNSEQSGDLSLSGILNALDGFETPDGLVTICTSNHKEKLDEALIRPGRLDRTFTLDYIASTELERLFAWFYEEEVPSPAPAFGPELKLSPAAATEVFKQHFEDGKAGWAAVLELVQKKPELKAVA